MKIARVPLLLLALTMSFLVVPEAFGGKKARGSFGGSAKSSQAEICGGYGIWCDDGRVDCCTDSFDECWDYCESHCGHECFYYPAES